MVVKVTRKVFINKKTKQGSVTLPKRELKRLDPTLKFGEDMFVELKILKRRRLIDGKKKTD